MPMDVDYSWCLSLPAERLSVFMANSRDGSRIFAARMLLRRTEISSASLARVLIAYPFMTFRVIFAIHWQALKLWIKGCPVYPHPEKEARAHSQTS
jgi:DUF1365 family protein